MAFIMMYNLIHQLFPHKKIQTHFNGFFNCQCLQGNIMRQTVPHTEIYPQLHIYFNDTLKI